MSLPVHCARCGRHPWQQLRVERVGDEWLCNGDDCAEWTAKVRPAPEPLKGYDTPIIHWSIAQADGVPR